MNEAACQELAEEEGLDIDIIEREHFDEEEV